MGKAVNAYLLVEALLKIKYALRKIRHFFAWNDLGLPVTLNFKVLLFNFQAKTI